MLLSVFSWHIIKVSHYIQFFFYAYSINSALHTLPAPMPYGYKKTPLCICNFVTACNQCDLVNFFCKYIACFFPKVLLHLLYCFILLQICFLAFKINFGFYYELLCAFCFFVSTAIVCQITVHLWSQSHKLSHYSSTHFILH